MTGDPPYRVVVIGAGFAGIGMGVALRQAGINDFLIVLDLLAKNDLDDGGRRRC